MGNLSHSLRVESCQRPSVELEPRLTTPSLTTLPPPPQDKAYPPALYLSCTIINLLIYFFYRVVYPTYMCNTFFAYVIFLCRVMAEERKLPRTKSSPLGHLSSASPVGAVRQPPRRCLTHALIHVSLWRELREVKRHRRDVASAVVISRNPRSVTHLA